MSVREWYAGREVLLTGVTSDVGQAVLEKLLRSCPEVARIYLAIRSRNGLNPEERLEKILSSPGFQRINQDGSKSRLRLKPLDGNLLYSDLRLAENERALLNDVSIIIHAGGPHESILELACELPALRTVAMVSNIFKLRGYISETFRKETVPNIPLALIRMPCIGPAVQEPIPGFMNVLRGSSAIMVGAGFAFGNADATAAVVPVDMAANSLIVAAWDKGNTNGDETTTIYNIPTLGCSWGTLIDKGQKASKAFPYPSFGVRGMTSRSWLRWIVVFVLEWLPSVLCDAVLPIFGVKSRLAEEHALVTKALQAMEPVLSRSWDSDQNRIYKLHDQLNAEDKIEFCLRTDFDLETYLLCAAATAGKISLNANITTIVKNLKLVFLISFIAILLFIIFV